MAAGRFCVKCQYAGCRFVCIYVFRGSVHNLLVLAYDTAPQRSFFAYGLIVCRRQLSLNPLSSTEY